MKYQFKVFAATVLLLSVFFLTSLAVGAADAEFEKSISAFPESYRVHLRELHDQYPNWKFTALDTGINWDDALAGELDGGRRNLVSDNYSSNILKSTAKGDYDPSNGTYIHKDTGWVTANEIAVSYCMDPRNSLNKAQIFQFELLSFDESYNLDAIETVLFGSFMYNTNITYYNSSGMKLSLNIKYSEAIYEAGQKYNVNPVFLASKILNEVGTNGSGSTSGTYSGYPGIYNFYNIGATDGAGAIARGLAWASSGTTYSRPWTNPYRSILGGAEYISAGYIAKGQNTGYLQKFQVNRNSSYPLYSHQYMTNAYGAIAQGYSTYLSYLGSGTISDARVFLIPVFDNMPGETRAAENIALADSAYQSGVVTASSCNVRTGPSTNNSKLAVTLTSGTKLTITGKCFTDSLYYGSYLKYPYWYAVSFSVDGVNYSGYIPADFANITSVSYFSTGSAVLKTEMMPGGSDGYATLISSDTSVATVSGSNVTFLKQGNVTLTAYTATGGYDVLKVSVNNSASSYRSVSGISCVYSGENNVKLSWNAVPSAAGYNVCIYDLQLNRVYSFTTPSTTCNVTSLKAGTRYYFRVRSYTVSSGVTSYGGFGDSYSKAATVPLQVTDVVATMKSSSSFTLSWPHVSSRSGYFVYRYDSNTGKYVYQATCTSNTYTVNAPVSEASLYYVRAYVYFGTSYYYGKMSGDCKLSFGSLDVALLKQSDTTQSGYVMSWTSKAAGFEIYRYNKSSDIFEKISETKNCSYTVSGLAPGTVNVYRVRGYVLNGSERVYGERTENTTFATLPATPGSLRVSDYDKTTATVTWGSVSGATGYEVYLYDESAGVYKLAAKVTQTSYTLTDLTVGVEKKCRVRAFTAVMTGTYYSSYSDSVGVVTGTQTVSGLTGSSSGGSIVLSWNPVRSTSTYEVWRYESALQQYVLAATTGDTSYYCFGMESGEQHTYKVRACTVINGEKVYGGYSSELSVTAK